MEGLADAPMVAVKNPPPGSEMLLFCLHEEGVGRVGWCLSERREVTTLPLPHLLCPGTPCHGVI